MLMVQALDFTFNGTSLSDISSDIILVSFDTSAVDNDVQFITSAIDRSDILYNNPIANVYAKTAEDVLKFSVTFARADGKMLSQQEIRELTSWLLAPKTARLAHFTPYTSDLANNYAVYEDVNYIGLFTNAYYQEMGQSRKMGVSFDFENISPYGFSDEKSFSFVSGGGERHLVETVESITGELINPTITITPTANGVVTINNVSDTSRDELSVNVRSGQTVVIMNGVAYLSDGSLFNLENFNNFNFPVLIDGDNTISISGDCSVNFKYREFINVGV